MIQQSWAWPSRWSVRFCSTSTDVINLFVKPGWFDYSASSFELAERSISGGRGCHFDEAPARRGSARDGRGFPWRQNWKGGETYGAKIDRAKLASFCTMHYIEHVSNSRPGGQMVSFNVALKSLKYLIDLVTFRYCRSLFILSYNYIWPLEGNRYADVAPSEKMSLTPLV